MRAVLEFFRRILGIQFLISQVDQLRVEIAELHRLAQREFTRCDDRDRDLVVLLRESVRLENPGVKLETAHPVAVRSDDHRFPRGTMCDNTRHPRFVRACEMVLGKPLRHLDLGCAGGGLVWDFVIAGHDSYGIEGSDLSLREQRAEWRTIPQRLFTADITQPFRLLDTRGNAIKFNVITAWEVLEHIPQDSLPDFFQNVVDHLRPGGLFVASIATFEDQDPESGAVWHVTVRPEQWWRDKIEALGFTREEELFSSADFVRGSGNIRSLNDWDASTDPNLGFHVVYRR